MNVINPYLKQYKKNQIETATPEQILILLYDGAIQYLNRAKVALEQSNNEQFYSNLTGCEKIIEEFMNTLDMELGGKLAENLYRLYEYLYNLLVKTGGNRKVENIDEVLRHLTSLRETWQKAIEIANSEKAANLIDEDEKNNSNDAYKDEYVENDEDEDEYESEDEEADGVPE